MNEAPSQFCPACGRIAPVGATLCPSCGHNFATYVPNTSNYYRPITPAQADTNKLLVTLLLWFFLGGFGAHRFYLGHNETGATMLILMILGIATSCILIGIIPILAVSLWAFIDLFLIVTGSLKPKDGSRLV